MMSGFKAFALSNEGFNLCRYATERRLDTLCVNSDKFSGSSRNFPVSCHVGAFSFLLKFFSDQSYEEWGQGRLFTYFKP